MTMRTTRRGFVAGSLLGTTLLRSPAMAQTVPSGPVTIEFYGIASGGWQPVIDDFQKAYPNITVKWTKFGVDDLKQALKVAASSRKMPTMWYNWGGTLQSQYDRAGLALDTTALLAQTGLDQAINPAALALGKDEGKSWGMPYRLIPMSIIYRRDIFEGAGATVPKTFAEFEGVLATLLAKGVTPFATGGKFGWMTMRYIDILLEHFAGSAKHDALKGLAVSWKDPAVTAAYTKLKEWADKGYFNRGFLGVDPTTAPTMLYDGRCAMLLDSPGIEASRLLRDGVDLSKWATFVIPLDQSPNRISGFITQLQIAATAPPDQRDAALLFLKHLATPGNATKFLPTLGGPSAVKGVQIPPELPLSRRWVEILEGGVSMFLPADQALPQELVNTYFETNDAVVLGSVTPQQAGAQMDEAIARFKANR